MLLKKSRPVPPNTLPGQCCHNRPDMEPPVSPVPGKVPRPGPSSEMASDSETEVEPTEPELATQNEKERTYSFSNQRAFHLSLGDGSSIWIFAAGAKALITSRSFDHTCVCKEEKAVHCLHCACGQSPAGNSACVKGSKTFGTETLKNTTFPKRTLHAAIRV